MERLLDTQKRSRLDNLERQIFLEGEVVSTPAE
jgi:hypothetical protein